MTTRCSVCGSESFVFQPVLWDGLVNEWQLSPQERRYIDRQQGEHCTGCGAKLRCVALADAILSAMPFHVTTVQQAVIAPGVAGLAVLEINEAGTLHPWLRQIPGHVFAEYPCVDMHALPFDTDSFDMVIHADTLEHVADPVHALVECRRVLRPGGRLIFTIPIVVDRLTRGRDGLAPSYHGDPAVSADDYLVHTEFGADAWTDVMRAGFRQVSLNAVEFPSALAITASK